MDALCEDERLPEVDECTAKCAALRDRDDLALDHSDSRYSAGAIRARDFDGDTVQCRLVHVSLAAGPLGAADQCWQAALAPRPEPDDGTENPCLQDINQEAVRCEDYCKLNMVACQGAQAVYESTAQCIAACEDMPLGETPTAAVKTPRCRSAHSYNALTATRHALPALWTHRLRRMRRRLPVVLHPTSGRMRRDVRSRARRR